MGALLEILRHWTYRSPGLKTCATVFYEG